MVIAPAFVYARSRGHYDVVRGVIEGLILRRHNDADRREAAILDSLQRGFNEAVERERLDVPKLTLKIKSKELA